MNTKFFTDHRFLDAAVAGLRKKGDKKISLKESFSILLKSKYMLCIALVVISYNLVINLTEVLWKHQVKELYPDPNDYTLYMNHIVSLIGFVATLSSLFVSGNAIRKFGWTFTALITPFILLVTSAGFFTFFFMKKFSPEFVFALSGATPLMLVVFFGSAQNILSRGAKYSVFDATKEMSYVPLSSESKLIGKAAIDGVCSRLGKSSGSVVHQAFLLFFASVGASAPFVAAVLFLVIIVWIIAVQLLGKQFNELTNAETTAKPSITPICSPVKILPEHSLLKEQQAI
jgi:AAA family ATP:ADP antiporter